MNHYPYKIIFSDIDGTLLTSNQRITEATKRKILKLEMEGIPFILVSARMPLGIEPIQQLLGNYAPIVGYSSALILDENGTELYSCLLDGEIAGNICKKVKESFPQISISAYTHKRWMTEDPENSWIQREEKITGLRAEYENEKVWIQTGVHKLLLMGKEEEIIEAEEKLKTCFPQLSIAASQTNYLEIMNPDVKKSFAVEFLCKRFGISSDQAIAFGDGYNDFSMLQAAGRGYVMANAPEALKKQADYLAEDNDHEGLLKVLKELYG